MPLSEHEQRILAEIERRLLEEDPKFAHQVGSTFRAHLSRRLKLAALGFLVGLVVLVAGFAKNTGLGVAGFVIMLLAIAELARPGRAAAQAAPTGPRRRVVVGQAHRALASALGGARRPAAALTTATP